MRGFRLFLVVFTFVYTFSAQAVRQIIIDTDAGVGDSDDLVLLKVALKDHLVGKINLHGIMINNSSNDNYAPGLVTALKLYYGLEKLPVGAYKGNYPFPKNPFYEEALSPYAWLYGIMLKHPDFSLERKNHPDAVDFYRQTLCNASQKFDIVSVGFLTNLYLLLNSQADQNCPLTGEELIRQKVDTLAIMAGHRDTGYGFPDYNLKAHDWGITGKSKYTFEKLSNLASRTLVSPFEMQPHILVKTHSPYDPTAARVCKLEYLRNNSCMNVNLMTQLHTIGPLLVESPQFDLTVYDALVNGTQSNLKLVNQGSLNISTNAHSFWDYNTNHLNQYRVEYADDPAAWGNYKSYLSTLVENSKP